MQWLSQTLIACLYPGSPYERKYMAILLLNTLLEVWNAPDAGCKAYTKPTSHEDNAAPARNAGTLVVGGLHFKAFCDGFFDPQTTKLLLGRVQTTPMHLVKDASQHLLLPPSQMASFSVGQPN